MSIGVDVSISQLESRAIEDPLFNHPLGKIEKEKIYQYCLVLLGLVEMNKESKTKMNQLYYVLRIYHNSDKDIVAEELLRDVKLLTIENVNVVKNEFSKEQLDMLFVDLLILLEIGKKKDRQVEYILELIRFFEFSEDEFQEIKFLVRGILNQDEESLLEAVFERNINLFFKYAGIQTEYYVVSTLEAIQKISSKIIMVYGEKIKDGGYIDLDKFSKERIFFRNCVFDNIEGMRNADTKVVFKDCMFKNCVYEERETLKGSGLKYFRGQYIITLFDFKKVEINGCIFENCKVLGGARNSSIFKFEDSVLNENTFIDCEMGVNCYFLHGCGWIIYADNTRIYHCELRRCVTYGETEFTIIVFHMNNVVMNNGGEIIGCKFIECSSLARKSTNPGYSWRNYILSIEKNTKEVNNEFISCTAMQSGIKEGFEVKNIRE